MKIHILGIAGTMTAPLAVALKKLGHQVTGSDQEKIYPPISELISDIPLNKPIEKIDLAIIGSSFKSFQICINEFEQIKKQSTPYISATKYLAKNLIKSESVLVAGSYGKTTITSALSWLLPTANYFFGGQPVNNLPSLNFSDSNISIVEADESINGLDTKAKFLYYSVKNLILTSAQWEHKESYQTSLDNFNAFKKLVSNIPQDGLLVYNPKDSEIQKLLPFCLAKKIPYQPHQFFTTLIGRHNQDNINAVLTLCDELKINYDIISSFLGVKRRLEIISNKNNILVIDDFAQSATRVRSALEAVKFSYPNRPIKIYFEPHATFLQDKQSISEFTSIQNLFSDFVLGKIKFSTNKKNRVTIRDWQNCLSENLHYFPMDIDLINYFISSLAPNDILIHFSSGGLDGLANLKTVYNNI
jgi:UDP-N-acetylmuramate: L-alanyl-gamma-D-glutamyl-meso-diaminopimelate ligase